jgi:hypothetical protein
MFREAARALREGDAVQIYPEGTTHSGPALEPLLGQLIALVGMVFWYLPYLVPRLVVRRMAVDEEMLSTYKLVLAVLVLPLALAGWTALAAWWFGLRGALAALVLLPLLAWFLHQWADRWCRLRQDVTLFVRVLRHRDLRDRLLRRRARLAAEIEEIARALPRAQERQEG